MSRCFALALLILAACVASAVAEDPDDPPESPDVPPVIDRLIDAHNQIRSREDRKALKVGPQLMKAAQVHARDMAEHAKLSHEGSDGSTPAQRVERQGYHYVATGENVAEGQDTVAEVMDGWMNSPHHRRNILGDFTEIGAARTEDAEGHPYWAVEFGRPIPRLDPKEAAQAVVDQINKKRSDAGHPALTVAPKLTDAAQAAARDMAENDTLRRSDGGSLALEVVRREGYPYREIQQNTASGYSTPEKFVASLMASDDRDRSILGDHEHIGVGYARAGDGKPYWVVLLATPRQGP